MSEPSTIQKGMKVRIAKGTQIRSLHRGNFILTKSMTVTVDHVLPGMRLCLGVTDKSGELHFSPTAGWRELEDLCRKNGIKVSGPHDSKAYECLMLVDDVYTDAEGLVWYPTATPEVRWAGQGGYWNGASINDVQAV